MYWLVGTGTLEERTKAIRGQLAIDFGLAALPFYAEDKQCASLLAPEQPEKTYKRTEGMA